MIRREPDPDDPPPGPPMTDLEADAFAVGVSAWDAILPRGAPDDEDQQARRYCACLMIQQLWGTFVAEPRRTHVALRTLLQFLARSPG